MIRWVNIMGAQINDTHAQHEQSPQEKVRHYVNIMIINDPSDPS